MRINKISRKKIKNKSILKTHQRFTSEGHIVFTEEIHTIALGSNDAKRTKSTDSLETHAYQTSKDLLSEKKELKCNNITKQYKRGLTLVML